MNKIKEHSVICNVGSSFGGSQDQHNKKVVFHDVYSVYKIKKHYRWCLESVQKGLKNLAFALFKPQEAQSVKHYQQRTNQVEETLAEKVTVAFAFSAAVLLVCFSTFVVF